MSQNNKPILSAFADESSGIFTEQIDAVKRNNITHIEVRRFDKLGIQKHDLQTIRETKKIADDAGVAFSAVGSPLGKCQIDGDMEEQQEMCKHLIEIAHILETPYIRMFSFWLPRDEEVEPYRQQVIDNLGALVDIATGTGVMLAHENEKHIYGETARRCLDLYETFYPSGAFNGIFDFANFIQAGENPLTDCWPLLKNYTEYFHIKDALLADGKVVPPGEGDGSLKEILGEALANGYDSFMTLEPHLGESYGSTAEARFDCAAQALHRCLKSISE